MDWREQERYEAELKQLLAGRNLSPNTRAQSLAALILADAMRDAAQKIHMAANTTLGDTVPLVTEPMRALTSALENFDPGFS